MDFSTSCKKASKRNTESCYTRPLQKPHKVGIPRSALRNQLILENIFTYLDMESLKCARLVCSAWAAKGLKRLVKDIAGGRVAISLKPPFTTSTIQQLTRLITNHQIHHTLHLSFQQSNPTRCRNNHRHHQSAYKDISNNKNFKLNTGAWVTVLRLKMSLMDLEDATVVIKLLASMPHLTRCSLDFVEFKNTLQSIPISGFIPSTVSTLGLRLSSSSIHTGLVASHLMRAVSHSNIQFLDLDELKQVCSNCGDVTNSWMKVIFDIMNRDPNAFPRLTGLRNTLLNQFDVQFLTTFPKSLSHIDLVICSEYKRVNDVHEMLKRHERTLRTFEFSWFIEKKPLQVDMGEYYAYDFPTFTSIDFISTGRLKDKWGTYHSDYHTIMKFFWV